MSSPCPTLTPTDVESDFTWTGDPVYLILPGKEYAARTVYLRLVRDKVFGDRIRVVTQGNGEDYSDIWMSLPEVPK